MFRRLAIIFFFVVFLFIPNRIAAVETTNTTVNKVRPTPSAEKLKMIEEEKARLRLQKQNLIKNQIKQKVQEKRASVEAKLDDTRKQHIRNLFAVMQNRFTAAIERLNKLIERIESRLAQIKSDNPNVNTTSIEAELQSAKDKTTDVEAQLAAISASLDDTLNSNQPKDAFSVIANDLKTVKNTLIEVHRLLVKVIGDVKGLRVGNTT